MISLFGVSTCVFARIVWLSRINRRMLSYTLHVQYIYIYIYVLIYSIHIYTNVKSNMMRVATSPTITWHIPPKKDTLPLAEKPNESTSSRCHLSVTLPSLHHACWKWIALKGTLNVWYQPLGSDNTSSPPRNTGVPESWVPPQKMVEERPDIQISACLVSGLFQGKNISHFETSLVLFGVYGCCFFLVEWQDGYTYKLMQTWSWTSTRWTMRVSKGTVLLYRLCFFSFQTAGVYLKPYEQKQLLFGQGRGHGLVMALWGNSLVFVFRDVMFGEQTCSRETK